MLNYHERAQNFHMLSVYNARHHCESEWFMNKVGDWLGYIGIDPKDAS